jgi:hypothetical protein
MSPEEIEELNKWFHEKYDEALETDAGKLFVFTQMAYYIDVMLGGNLVQKGKK